MCLESAPPAIHPPANTQPTKKPPFRVAFSVSLLSIHHHQMTSSMKAKLGRNEKFYPGIELFLQEATLQLSSPLLRFTTEFEMDRSG
ncbi:hypothetical protein, partial [Synechococcus sp. L2F]|uniref:hypothetical protein n=1 Tax=Synechococcus sp. L2F TaxID=2823739 RepID=UPI0020CBC891